VHEFVRIVRSREAFSIARNRVVSAIPSSLGLFLQGDGGRGAFSPVQRPPRVEEIEHRLAPSGVFGAIQEIALAQAAAIEAARIQAVEARGQVAEIQQASVERDLDAARQASEQQLTAATGAFLSGPVVVEPIELRAADPALELTDQPWSGGELQEAIQRHQDAMDAQMDLMRKYLEMMRDLNPAITS
jgi:hypothetical protein